MRPHPDRLLPSTRSQRPQPHHDDCGHAAHRVAYVRSLNLQRPDVADRPGGSAGALASLIHFAARRRDFDKTLAAVTAPVLVVHAADDHHVPVDFALAAAGHRGWAIRILDHGGHHIHVHQPRSWLDAVTPWLRGITDRQRHA